MRLGPSATGATDAVRVGLSPVVEGAGRVRGVAEESEHPRSLSHYNVPAAAILIVLALLLGVVAIISSTRGGVPGQTQLSPELLALSMGALALGLIAVVLLVLEFRREGLHIDSLRLLESAPAALVLTDTSLRIRHVNPAAERLLGHPRRELLGQDIGALLESDPRFGHVEVQAVGSNGQSKVIRGGDGRLLGASTGGLSELSISTTRGYHVLFLEDVSARARLVDALAKRGAELARSNRDLEQFAYVASHDLQEPIRMVGSFTQLLQKRYKGKLDAEADEFLDFAQDGATRMRQLVDDLLSVSRLDSRAQPFQPVALEEVLAEAVANLAPNITESRATIEHEPLPSLMGDRGQLVQVFQNLLGNAIKYRSEEPPHIRISAGEEGPDWKIVVADNGLGVPPDSRERIFQMFQRLHSRAEYPGSGIGLSIVRKVVERHGGKIWVESAGTPGEGSRFIFKLPKDPNRPTLVPQTTGPEGAPLPEETARLLIRERLEELA